MLKRSTTRSRTRTYHSKSIGEDCPAIYNDNFFQFVHMNLIIDRELVWFDLETTGLSVSKDRVIQLCMIKFFPQTESGAMREPIVKTKLINPGPEGIELMKLPNTAPHNIKWEQLVDKATFRQYSKGMRQFLGNADLGGHNILNFDIPMLREEFMRCGINDWPPEHCRFIDTYRIFSKLIPRTLAGAVSFFTNDKMNEHAHDAEYDIRMTIKVLEGMLDYSTEFGNTTEELHQYTNADADGIDWNGYLIMDSKSQIVFNFGKHKGKRVIDHPDYCKWVMTHDYPADTKQALIKIFKLHNREIQ